MTKSRIWAFFGILLLAYGGTAGAGTLFDIDFGAATRRVDSDRAGSMHGVLPTGVNDNFSGWSAGSRVTTELRREGERRFLRFSTPRGATGGQFVIAGLEPPFPGCFRLTVSCRVVADRALAMGLRLCGSPYTDFSSHSFGSPEWQEQTTFFEVRQAGRPGDVGFYLYTSPGETDIARIRLEAVTEDELAATIPRPPKGQTDFIRHARFPLGLPCGWNLGRRCVDATCAADAREPAADGVPVLKVSAEMPWDVWGEAFQTGHPEEPHTLRFLYRSEAPAKAEVVDDSGRRAGELALAASKGWREARLVFRPMKLSSSFGLRFSGERGPFWLDRVRVHLGDGEAPPGPHPVQVALAADEGEIASETRIQFTDEPPRLRLDVRGLPSDGRVRVTVADLYGRERELGTFDSSVCAAGPLTFLNRAFGDAAVGQFRVTARAERADGARLSADEELVVTRLPRPVAWGRDASDSPFGCHFNPNRATVRLMKAGGVNWARLHDSGGDVSGWFAQEPRKGEWNFHDREVAAYRDANVKIFAQLGTAPAWATHFGDLGYKWMGYFEKYLRPTNSVDWVNYVTKYVKHHERNIDEYFVWNEPWGAWWARAADIRWYDAEKAGEDFAAFTRLTYDAVKRVNPKIRVCGFNSTDGDLGARWSRDVLAGGGFEACDAIDWHYYTPDPRGLQSDENVTAKPLGPIRAKHPDLGGKPVYMSEGQGTSTGGGGQVGRLSGLLKASVPWPAEDLAGAAVLGDRTCRYILSLLAEGNARIFLYTAHSSEGLAKMPRFQVLLGADGFAHPALVAHAQLAQAVEGRRFVRKENAGAKGVRYVFRGRGKEVSAYSGLTADEVRALRATTPLKDLYGNPVAAEPRLPGTLVYAESDI